MSVEPVVGYNAERIPDLLGPGGRLAAELVRYEDRLDQREFALEVARLLEDGGRLAVEAPTGIGKSLAYGVPAAAWAAEGNGPVIISTHTRALQQQLLDQEAPRIARALGREVAWRVLKGRTNYLCRRRFEVAASEATGDGTIRLIERLRPWTERTVGGDFAETDVRHPRDLQYMHLRLASDPDFCSHSGCTPETGCFFKRARARAATGGVVIVNHALLAIDLFGGFEILPAFDALVVDEAHAFVRTALDQLGTAFGPGRILRLMELVPGRGDADLDELRAGEGASRLAAVHRASRELEAAARHYFAARNGKPRGGEERRRYRSPETLAVLHPMERDPIEDALGTLAADAQSLGAFLARDAGEESARLESARSQVRRLAEETAGLRDDLLTVTTPDPDDRDHVWWSEWHGDAFTLRSAPLELGPRLRRALEDGPRALVFTSATLAAGKDFRFFAREVGFENDLPAVAYPSPFDFPQQTFVAAVRRGPDPRDPGWAGSTARTLRALIEDPGRKTMALFTSYRDLTGVREALEDLAVPADWELLAQGEGGTATALLDRFRAAPRALLLGTASFWEGVDLPGEHLEVLVVTRLPFGVPTEPRLQARSERLEEQGGNPFRELYLPEAVLRFKQGFGRLIRRRSDRGVVTVLDPRLLGKSYGRTFQAALPVPVTPADDPPALARAVAAWWRDHSDPTQGDSE